MSMSTLILAAVAALAAAVLIAGALIASQRPWLGVLLGLLPIAVMEALLWATLRGAVDRCIDSACASAGLGPGCEIARFGCTEWTGIAAIFFLLAGLLDLILYLVIAAAIVLVVNWRRRKASGSAAA